MLDAPANPSLPLTRTLACICGLAAFAIAIVAGLAADNPADVILARALVSMAVCAAVGAAAGAAAGTVVEESIARHKAGPGAPSASPAQESPIVS